MNTTLKDFVQQHDFLICVDSDGCAVDNLTSKHMLCFAPCLIRIWGLEKWTESVNALWARINLTSLTRGIHRYRALAQALEEINRTMTPVEDLPVLLHWVETTEDFTEEYLDAEIRENPSPILEKARRWSSETNRAIDALPWDKKQLFPGVKEALSEAGRNADIAVISSANRDAVVAEWVHGGMAGSVTGFLCQEAGKKTRLIAGLRRMGYPEDQILVIGDSPGDRASAELNGVSFYPILTGREAESWAELSRLLPLFFEGEYRAAEIRLSEEFMLNLSGGLTHD